MQISYFIDIFLLMKGSDKCLKIRLIGNDGEKRKIKEIVNNLNCNVDIEEIPIQDKLKYNIKYTPAMIIDNVVVGDLSKLSDDELKEIVNDFLET